MRRFHPVRALRRSGWRSRAALAVVLAGVIAGPLAAGPAEAHGNAVHTVIVRGTMHIVDIDGGVLDPFPDICDVNVTQSASFQRTSSNPNPRVNIDIVRGCNNEIFGFLRVNAAWTPDTTSPHVDSDGFARVNERTCFLIKALCNDTTIANRPYAAFFLERTTEQRLRIELGQADRGFVTFDFEVVII